MPRQNHKDEVGAEIPMLVGLAVALLFLVAGIRLGANSQGILLIVFALLCFGAAIAVFVYLLSTRPQSSPFQAVDLQDALARTQNTRSKTQCVPPVNLLGKSYRVSVPGPPVLPPATRPELAAPRLPGKLELVDRLRSVDWFQFEKIVALAYRKHGYTVTRRGGANPDGGIDLLISKDGETQAVQCKQWKTWKVGVKTVREFLGALTDAQIKRGIIITLQGSTYAAQSLASKHNIALMNETDLANLLERASARFDPVVLELLADRHKVCPKCEHEMVKRTTRHGPHAGQTFWGCSTYPRCHFTLPAT